MPFHLALYFLTSDKKNNVYKIHNIIVQLVAIKNRMSRHLPPTVSITRGDVHAKERKKKSIKKLKNIEIIP